MQPNLAKSAKIQKGKEKLNEQRNPTNADASTSALHGK